MNSLGTMITKTYPKLKDFVTKLTHPFTDVKHAHSAITHTDKQPVTPLIDAQAINLLRDAIENLHVALNAENIRGKQKAAQEKACELIMQALALNVEFHHDTIPYSWFAYYSEKNMAEKISKQLMHLKEVLPSEWANRTRGEVRGLAFAYAHYLSTCKQTLEQKMFSMYRNATFQMYN